MKIVYSDKKTGKTAQIDVEKEREALLLGRKIDEIIDGSAIGLEGYKLKITGLSDSMGTPSRKEIEGTRKARPLLGRAPGIRSAKSGFRRKKLIRGNTVSADTSQVNTVIVEYGSKPADELFKPKEKKEEEKKE